MNHRNWHSHILKVISVQFSSLVQCPTLFTPWTAAHQASLCLTNSWSLLKFLSIKSVMPSNHLILYHTVCVKLLSLIRLFATPWTVGHQTPLSMRFSRQEYWSGLPFPSPGDLPDPRIEPRSPALQADALPSESPGRLLTLDCAQIDCVKLLEKHSNRLPTAWCIAGAEIEVCRWFGWGEGEIQCGHG